MFLFTAASLMILGIATLWAQGVIFGGTRLIANNIIALSLSIIGWVFILLGCVFLVSPLGILLALIVFGMVVARFRHGERRALLWTLSLAAEKGIPFAPSVRAFAARRSDEMARRALALADLLDAGVPLSIALAKSGNPLPPDTELMIRLSADSASAAVALRESREFSDEIEQAWAPIFGQFAYLVLVGLCTTLVFAFIMVQIMPTIHEIFIDFEVEMPALTRLIIQFSSWVASYLFLLTPLLAFIVASMLVGGFFYSRGRIWFPPPFNWLFGRTDKPTLLRGLAVCLEQEMAVHEALGRIGRDYPTLRTRQGLAKCAAATSAGANWCEAMQRERLITPAEAAVLKASIPSGNQQWALRELAAVATRRMIYRAKTVFSIVAAVSIVMMTLPIGLLAIGCFVPLVRLIQEASLAQL
jgi:type II secretory pathway component PulF